MVFEVRDPIFAVKTNNGDTYDRKQYGSQMRELAEECLTLINSVDNVNDHVISLMILANLLQSHYEGDASEPSRIDPQSDVLADIEE